MLVRVIIVIVKQHGASIMKNNYRKAFTALKKIGAPVIEGGDNGEDTFRISGEDNVDEIWADYYEEFTSSSENFLFGVNNKINDILDKQGLYAEWINPGVLSVQES